jgi:uncharacterized protein (TIGR02453 family)
MATAKPVFTSETFRFFKDLGRHNKTVWMHANRDRYESSIVKPFRNLLEKLSPAVLKLNINFDTSGRTGANFSRINRDIRFAKDKTPYKTQMYLKYSVTEGVSGETGQLYVGLSHDAATAGFRIYSGGKRKESILALLTEPRALARPRWITQQKKRLSRRYESYWYSTEKGEWTKHDGWPTAPEEWKKIQAWIVRKKFSTSAATRAAFPGDVSKIFRDLYPLLSFTSLPD